MIFPDQRGKILPILMGPVLMDELDVGLGSTKGDVVPFLLEKFL